MRAGRDHRSARAQAGTTNAAATELGEEKLRRGLNDRVHVETIGAVEIGQTAGLPETIDAEGTDPLPAHPAFRPAGLSEDAAVDWVAERFPVTADVVDGSLCLQRRHLDPDAGPLLQRYADAFEKVWQHFDLIRRMAGSRPAPGWREVLRRG